MNRTPLWARCIIPGSTLSCAGVPSPPEFLTSKPLTKRFPVSVVTLYVTSTSLFCTMNAGFLRYFISSNSLLSWPFLLPCLEPSRFERYFSISSMSLSLFLGESVSGTSLAKVRTLSTDCDRRSLILCLLPALFTFTFAFIPRASR